MYLTLKQKQGGNTSQAKKVSKITIIQLFIRKAETINRDISTVAKCLFVIIRIEAPKGDNRYLFIVYRSSVSVTYRLRLWVSAVVFSYLTFLRFTTNSCIHQLAFGNLVNTTLQIENCKVQKSKFFLLLVFFVDILHFFLISALFILHFSIFNLQFAIRHSQNAD